MQKATLLAAIFVFAGLTAAHAQKTDFVWVPDPEVGFGTNPLTQLPNPPAYFPGLHSGARSVAGPHDLDGDGKIEVILSDYTGGGRIHMLESVGPDTWELVYSSPFLDSTGTTNNARGIVAGDLDGDGLGEVFVFTGRNFSPTNPFAALIQPALLSLEVIGDNTFGALPDSYTFADVADGLPDRWRTEQMIISDVDGDGANELLFGNNGAANNFDSWYVISATELGTGLGGWLTEARWSSRNDDNDPVNRGGGSAYGITPANLDGGSDMEIAMMSWNNLNFTNAKATGPDTYVAPTETDTAAFYQASPNDHVALFGCQAVDMDGNGDDEVYCPNLYTGDVTLLNYEAGENALEIHESNIVLGLIPGLSALGITAGDIDNDGRVELLGSGPSYTLGAYEAGESPTWVRIADYNEGDVEDPANYSVRGIQSPDDLVNVFNTVNRDSAGVMTTYLEDGPAGPEFAGKLAFLGDPDGDGQNEVAMSFQGVDDSLYVFNEVFNPADSTYTRTVESAVPHPNRAFLRVISGDGLGVSIEHDRVIVPSDFELHPNYPNPFNPSTTFSFTLPLDKRVSVRIYDVTGRLVRTLVNDEMYSEGTHNVTWDGLGNGRQPVASGNYFYTLEWGQFRHARQMILIK